MRESLHMARKVRRALQIALQTADPCPGIQRLEQLCGNLPVRPRAAGRHDDASPIELRTFFAALDPVEERGLVHAHGQLNIHGRLIAGRYSNPHAMKKGRATCVLLPLDRTETPDGIASSTEISFSVRCQRLEDAGRMPVPRIGMGGDSLYV